MRITLLATLILFWLPALAPAAQEDDNLVRDMMMKESVRNFVGHCGCPFHRKSNGELCGVKSGYDLSNGRMPLCYRTDITVEMVEEYRARKAREQGLGTK